MATEPADGMVLISEGAYRLLLQLYPRKFRDAWGLHMSRTFRDHSRERYRRDGIIGLFGLWWFTAVDVCKTALEERAHTGEWFMSRETVTRIGGPAMMVAGVLWLVGAIDQFSSWTWMLLIPISIAQGIGTLALNAYLSASASRATRSLPLLALAAVGIAIVALVVATVLYRSEIWQTLFKVFVVSFTLHFALLLPLGVLLREPLLPRGGGLPLLLTLPVMLMFAAGAYTLIATGDWLDIPLWLAAVGFVGAGIGLGLIGYAMLPSKGHAAASVQA